MVVVLFELSNIPNSKFRPRHPLEATRRKASLSEGRTDGTLCGSKTQNSCPLSSSHFLLTRKATNRFEPFHSGQRVTMTRMKNSCMISLVPLLLLLLWSRCDAFQQQPFLWSRTTTTPTQFHFPTFLQSEQSGYIPQQEDSSITTTKSKTKKLVPQIGDVVTFDRLDGGKVDGETLVGKISFLTQVTSSKEWIAQVNLLENVGDGYYAEYSSNKRSKMQTDVNVSLLKPLAASFVKSEAAWKVPITSQGKPKPKSKPYDLEDYQGPASLQVTVNPDVLEQDLQLYNGIKTNLFKYAALTGLLGTVVTNFSKGTEDAAIYLAGVVASLGYLLLLTVKTDTVASPDAKLGKGIANLRFAMPVIVLVGVALYNMQTGQLPNSSNPLDTVTPEQFGAAILGFLTYRVPLLVSQLGEAVLGNDPNGGVLVPGSAGVALELLKEDTSSTTTALDATLPPLFIISSPAAIAPQRKQLVQRFLSSSQQEDDDGTTTFVAPKSIDRMTDGVTYERLEARGELLETDGRFGLTKEAILSIASDSSVAVVDASVPLAKELSSRLAGQRQLIGVWIGVSSMNELESSIQDQMDNGSLKMDNDTEMSREEFLRLKVKESVQDIEYGISAGFFEFTILLKNDNQEDMLQELQQASQYCVKSK